MPQTFFPIFPNDATSINEVLGFAQRDDMVYYFHGSMPIYSHHVDNLKMFRLITAQLVVNGNATQMEIVRAFGISKISMKRYVKLYREEGPDGFFKPRKARSATVMTKERLSEIQTMLEEGDSASMIANQLGLRVDTVNKALRDGRLHRIKKKR